MTAIDPAVLDECTGKLPFAHSGCGGALILGTDEEGIHFNPVRYTWSQVQIWSADGAVVIRAKHDKKAHASFSYIQVSNAHLLEQLIRMAFKQSGLTRLSDLLG